jgi:hypothetical protein
MWSADSGLARGLQLGPRTGPRHRIGECDYLTVSVPSMPAIRCPGTEQKNL